MKIVNIIGGLGNQMFQYAFAVALKKRFPQEDVKIDVHLLESYGLHNGYELRRLFDLSLPEAERKDVKGMVMWLPYKYYRIWRRLNLDRRRFNDPYLYSTKVMEREGNVYYDGIWQDARYFEDVCEDVKREFCFRSELIDAETEAMCQRMMSELGAVSIHVRRGDYLLHANYRGLCGEDYYRRAMDYVKGKVENPRFYIFSNDMEWCREHLVQFAGDCPCEFIDRNHGIDSFKDLALMSCCSTNIIANSSFSWWGAYLNRHNRPLIVAPAKWTNAENSYERVMEEWIKI